MRTSLHSLVALTRAQKQVLVGRSAQIARARMPARAAALLVAKAAPAVSIPLTTVTADGGFDAYVDITFPGAGGAWLASLRVDSGNDSLIFPDYAAIAGLPGFTQNYEVIEYDIAEPFGAPACRLRGPIRLPTTGKDPLTIP